MGGLQRGRGPQRADCTDFKRAGSGNQVWGLAELQIRDAGAAGSILLGACIAAKQAKGLRRVNARQNAA